MESSSYISSSGEYFDAMELTLTGTYTYTIRLDPREMGVGSMTVQLYDVPADVKAEIRPGGPAVTVATTGIGQNASLTFSGVAGQRISMRVFGISSQNAIAMTLLRPDGTTIASSSYISSYGAFFDVMELQLSGTYIVKLDPREMAVGSMTVQLYELPAEVITAPVPGGAGCNSHDHSARPKPQSEFQWHRWTNGDDLLRRQRIRLLRHKPAQSGWRLNQITVCVRLERQA